MTTTGRTLSCGLLRNEDVCLLIKTIDNSRVVRHADPKVRNARWRFIGIASVVVLLVVGQLLPAAYRLLAGYQLNRLEKQHAELMDMRRTLQLTKRVLRSPNTLNNSPSYTVWKPLPRRVHDIAPADEESLALNRACAKAPLQPLHRGLKEYRHEPFESAPAAASAGQKRLSILARSPRSGPRVTFVRLVMLQVVKHDEYVKMASGQHERQQEIQAPRGELRCSGRRIAMSVELDSVSVNPRALATQACPPKFSPGCSASTHANCALRFRIFRSAIRRLKRVKRTISREESERLRALQLDWSTCLRKASGFIPMERWVRTSLARWTRSSTEMQVSSWV